MQDNEYILVKANETSVVVTPQDQVVTSVVQELATATVELKSTVAAEIREFHVVTVAPCGGTSTGTGTGGGGGVFVLDVTATSSGIVGSKQYDPDVVPANTVVDYCMSDTSHVRVYVGCNGGTDNYSPVIQVNGITATLTESATKRWFTGYADLTLDSGVNDVTVVSDAGGTDTVQIEVLGAGPEILGISFGPYPGTQTELKSGDHISVTITTQLDATSVTVLAQGAVTGGTFPVSGGVATGTLTISGGSGQQVVTAKAQNSFGTFGNTYDSAALTLNQTYPTFGSPSVVYPSGQGALKGYETADVTVTVSNFTTVQYSSAHLTVPSPTTYSATKTVTNNYTGYEVTNNLTITANRAANNATASTQVTVKIADIAPTASIVISPTGRLVSSPTGIAYDVRITPNQVLNAAPTMSASLGAMPGPFTQSGSYWHATLTINDNVTKGTGVFSNLVLTGLSNMVGSTITSGGTYIVGGFNSRTVTFPQYSRVAPLGTYVADRTKVTCQVGTNFYTRVDTNASNPGATTFFIANSDGSYNPNGNYVGLSDSDITGANTSGTLSAIVQETA